MIFPVCECGVIPLARRLIRKGVRLPVGIAFMLAAPVVNPVVIGSTIAAFGLGPMALWRFALSGLIAVAVGLVFSVERQPQRLLQVTPIQGGTSAADAAILRKSLGGRVQQALQIAAEEFFEMGRFLILGAALAALMQTLVPQSFLLGLGSGPVRSVLVLMLLAAVLSICSTVDPRGPGFRPGLHRRIRAGLPGLRTDGGYQEHPVVPECVSPPYRALHIAAHLHAHDGRGGFRQPVPALGMSEG
jgi:uncharacterized membrane protein YraQ (UPF0718 family)